MKTDDTFLRVALFVGGLALVLLFGSAAYYVLVPDPVLSSPLRIILVIVAAAVSVFGLLIMIGSFNLERDYEEL